MKMKKLVALVMTGSFGILCSMAMPVVLSRHQRRAGCFQAQGVQQLIWHGPINNTTASP